MGALLDVRTVFDEDSAVISTLREALESDGHSGAVAWVALPDQTGGLVVERVLGQETGGLIRLNVGAGEGMTGRVFERATIHWVDDYFGSPTITHQFDHIIESEHVQRMIAAPLSLDKDILGVLTVGRRSSGPFADKTVSNIENLAQRASFALGIAKRSRDKAAAAALAERRRISEELHDGLSAMLFSIAARTDQLQRRAAAIEIQREIADLQRELVEAGGLVRSLVSQWHGEATADLHAEVQGVVDEFERRTGITSVAVFLGSLPPIDGARVQALSRFVAVALSNVERHTNAHHASVTVASVPTQVTVAVSNDGPAPASLVPGIGLTGAEDRITRLGGSIAVLTEDDVTGFTIRARLPT
ncbi:GAF domain-containing protein [Williamsia sp. 1138]|uniref:GAF domain-containing sensor histidine kinase n=1 Tax=Williamsia sp. 1138 TaxID=1903117 RepID=UPI001181192A|nr:GAF domain-containing protein [Williamsia sp. 1138]